MAQVRIDNDTLIVELSGWEKLWAIHGSFRIPLASITAASTTKPPSFWESLKLIGTDAGSLKMAGSFLYHGETVFFDYHGDENVLVVDLVENASRYKHLFVHVDAPDTPDAAASRITGALASKSAT